MKRIIIVILAVAFIFIIASSSMLADSPDIKQNDIPSHEYCINQEGCIMIDWHDETLSEAQKLSLENDLREALTQFYNENPDIVLVSPLSDEFYSNPYGNELVDCDDFVLYLYYD